MGGETAVVEKVDCGKWEGEGEEKESEVKEEKVTGEKVKERLKELMKMGC